MRRSCREFRLLARRERSGKLGPREFAALDRHLERCADCRERQRRQDPLAMFRVLAREEAGEPAWAGLWEGVRAGVQEGGRLGLWEGLGLLRPAYRVGLAAALVVAAGLAALLGPGGEPRSWEAGDPLSSLGSVAAASAPGLAAVESIESAEARIYEMKVVHDGEQVSQLVMIFDEEIDL